tara:strand:- start:3032 stop:4000 length:969 start_codon:yes stop_codon:yes gene_type:complete
MRAVIIGCGAIGAHIAYSLYEYGFHISILTQKYSYNKIIANGLNIQINNNKKLIIKKRLKKNKKFEIHKSIKTINKKNDYIFITVKLKDFDTNLINNIKEISNENTAIIPPCTNIPLWWINRFYPKDVDLHKINYFNLENIIGMTMWLSSVKLDYSTILVKHVQRGYPLKAINKKMKEKESILREAFKKNGKSPKIKNIYSEIFSKSLNALAFNMVALYFQQTNSEIQKNKSAIKMLEKIMIEGEKITNKLKLKLYQDYKQRIKQTLSSSIHTMSMLNDYQNGKKIELQYLWDSFSLLTKISSIKMPYTKKIYSNLRKKYIN